MESWITGVGADVHHKVPVGSWVTLCGIGTNTARNFMRYETQVVCGACQHRYSKIVDAAYERVVSEAAATTAPEPSFGGITY